MPFPIFQHTGTLSITRAFRNNNAVPHFLPDLITSYHREWCQAQPHLANSTTSPAISSISRLDNLNMKVILISSKTKDNSINKNNSNWITAKQIFYLPAPVNKSRKLETFRHFLPDAIVLHYKELCQVRSKKT